MTTSGKQRDSYWLKVTVDNKAVEIGEAIGDIMELGQGVQREFLVAHNTHQI